MEPEEEYWVDPLEEARRREGERKERRVVEERKVGWMLFSFVFHCVISYI